MNFQTFALLENIYFHVIIAPISLFGIFLLFKYLFKMKWNSKEAKITLLIILTILIIVELEVMILLVFKNNILYYLLSFTTGFLFVLYMFYFTIKSIINYSKNLILARDEIETSQKKYRNAYNNAELYKDVFAHDISNILQNLTFSLDFYNYLPAREKIKKNIQEVLNNFENQIRRGTELLSNVRVLSKLDIKEPAFNSIEIRKIVQDVIVEIKQKYVKEIIKFETHPENQQFIVQADINLYDLLKNLILNGIIHNNNPNKEISIKIGKDNQTYDNYLKIEIIDNGRGIDPHLKENYIKFFKKKYVF